MQEISARKNAFRQTLEELANNFADPPANSRGKPFWAWNGSLDEQELLRQVAVFEEMGMGGFFMHSRTGLQTEYLGEDWFRLINACADEAERRGLEAWIYDEDRWPSGSAGGLATKDIKHRMKYMRLQIVPPGNDFKWPEKTFFIAAFAANLEGVQLCSYERISYASNLRHSKKEHLVFTWEYMPESSFYNGSSYLDTMDKNATAQFLKTTHQKYAEHCGHRLGTSIKGIFTDEPHRGMVFCRQIAQNGPPDPGWTAPYTHKIWEQFIEAFGYDLRDYLPELFLLPEGRTISPVKWQYMEILQQLFLKNWAEPCMQWCREHNLKLTGHVLHEDSLGAAAIPCGSVMRYYPFLDYPGIDNLGLNNYTPWAVKQVVSVARQQGQKWILSELYGCTGWQTTFTDHKRIGDWQALNGINLRCHHLAWYSMEGESKRDYPASIFFQSAWYKDYKKVEDYFSRIHLLMRQGIPLADILVIHPVESLWAGIHVDWGDWLDVDAPFARPIENQFRTLQEWLSSEHLDFDYGDEDHIHRFGKIRDECGECSFQIGEMSYKVIIVAGCLTLRRTTYNQIKAFQEQGGTVIFVGDPPPYIDALQTSDAQNLASKGTPIAWDREQLTQTVRSASSQKLQIIGDHKQKIVCQARRLGDTLVIGLLNQADHPISGINLVLPGNLSAEEWDCRKGQRQHLNCEPVNDATSIQLDFDSRGERFLVLQPAESNPLKAAVTSFAKESGRRLLDGPFHYKLDEDNFCILDYPRYRFAGHDWQNPDYILNIDQVLREKTGFPQRSGQMCQPWFTAKTRDRNAGLVELEYSFYLEEIPPKLSLVMEAPSDFRTSLNGTLLRLEQIGGWLIDPCFRLFHIPTDLLRKGLNCLHLKADFHANLPLESIYLSGRFGVSRTGHIPRIGSLQKQLRIGCLTEQGLPFYSGTVAYELGLVQAGTIRIGLTAFGGATARLAGEQLGEHVPILFPPHNSGPVCLKEPQRIWVEIVLTRRNLFGPLHLIPKNQYIIEPMSFRSHGANFTSSYELFPSGLLEPPQLVHY